MKTNYYSLYTVDWENAFTATQNVYVNHKYLKQLLKSFDDIDFDTINTHFDNIDNEIINLNNKYDDLEDLVNEINTTTNERLTDLEKAYVQVDGDIVNLEADISEIQLLKEDKRVINATINDEGNVAIKSDDLELLVQRGGVIIVHNGSNIEYILRLVDSALNVTTRTALFVSAYMNNNLLGQMSLEFTYDTISSTIAVAKLDVLEYDIDDNGGGSWEGLKPLEPQFVSLDEIILTDEDIENVKQQKVYVSFSGSLGATDQVDTFSFIPQYYNLKTETTNNTFISGVVIIGGIILSFVLSNYSNSGDYDKNKFTLTTGLVLGGYEVTGFYYDEASSAVVLNDTDYGTRMAEIVFPKIKGYQENDLFGYGDLSHAIEYNGTIEINMQDGYNRQFRLKHYSNQNSIYTGTFECIEIDYSLNQLKLYQFNFLQIRPGYVATQRINIETFTYSLNRQE